MNCVTVLFVLLSAYIVYVHGFVIRVYLVEHPRNRQQTEDLTCWTCPGKSDNEECNDWAPERQCVYGRSWCKTVHRFNIHTGESILVNKECAPPEYCTVDHVGCQMTMEPGVMDCTTCCNQDYCNEYIASNHTQAIQQSSYLELHNTASSNGFNIFLVLLCTGLYYLFGLVLS